MTDASITTQGRRSFVVATIVVAVCNCLSLLQMSSIITVHAWAGVQRRCAIEKNDGIVDALFAYRRSHCHCCLSRPTILFPSKQHRQQHYTTQLFLNSVAEQDDGQGDMEQIRRIRTDEVDAVQQHHHHQQQQQQPINHQDSHHHRREFLSSTIMTLGSIATAVATTQTTFPKSVSARGLVHFPCILPLANTYHLMRVGTTLLEEQGMWSTNPLFLTNRDDALSPKGIEQVVETCQIIQQDEKQLPTLIKYSLAASCIDTATIVGQELKLGMDRIVPEFTFLDPRGIGSWDMSARDMTIPAVWAMDNDEAGTDGLMALPPSSDDGTPHEVLADQAVRLRQILSVLESQYSGDTILLIFPDGTGPALLSAMVAGIPYNRVHELEYQPGEIRFDVTMESTLALWKEKQTSADGKTYAATIQKGRSTLKELRATQKNGGTVTNLKDKLIEEERIMIENEYRKKQQQMLEEEQQKEQQRMQRQRDIIAQRQKTDGIDIGTETVLGVSSIVGTAGMAAWYYFSSLSKVTNGNTVIDAPIDNEKPLRPLTTTGGLFSLPIDESLNRGAIGRTTGLIRSNNQTGISTVKPFTVVDPKEKARIAMEEYMDRDDGADDWLLSLSQIIQEATTDEEHVIKMGTIVTNVDFLNMTKIDHLSSTNEDTSSSARNANDVVADSSKRVLPFL